MMPHQGDIVDRTGDCSSGQWVIFAEILIYESPQTRLTVEVVVPQGPH